MTGQQNGLELQVHRVDQTLLPAQVDSFVGCSFHCALHLPAIWRIIVRSFTSVQMFHTHTRNHMYILYILSYYDQFRSSGLFVTSLYWLYSKQCEIAGLSSGRCQACSILLEESLLSEDWLPGRPSKMGINEVQHVPSIANNIWYYLITGNIG